ncbi:MAG: penicillin-binding protein 2 [Alphaproteobacteria bacterium]|nr:penicillin-binding protein 2 [Alphaproteobacteria bacterium]
MQKANKNRKDKEKKLNSFKIGRDLPFIVPISLKKKKNLSAISNSLKIQAIVGVTIIYFFLGLNFIRISYDDTNQPILIDNEELTTVSSLNNTNITRSKITDRNGNILAVNLPSYNLGVRNPSTIKNPELFAKKLAAALNNEDASKILNRLKSNKNFVMIKSNLVPQEVTKVNALGAYQLEFSNSEMRVYPQGSLTSHAIGKTGIDLYSKFGKSGLEYALDEHLSSDKKDIRLTLDIGIQSIIYDNLVKGVEKYKAKGAMAILMKAQTGEILSMVSLPDFNPNEAVTNSSDEKYFNAATSGAFELGSIMKIFNCAIGLDTKAIKITDKFDAGAPIHLVGRTIVEPELENRRVMDISEIMIHSSNVGSVKIAQAFGPEKQKSYFEKLGFLDKVNMELPEKSKPLFPKRFTESASASMSYGYNISLTPIHAVAATAAVINGGIYHDPTLLPNDSPYKVKSIRDGKRIFSDETSRKMRGILRKIVLSGTGRKANVPGMEVGGKTGTANVVSNGQYKSNEVRTTFMSAFPMDAPKYVMMVMMNSPQAEPGISSEFARTAARNVVPITYDIISQIAPQLGIQPRPYEHTLPAPYVKQALGEK